MDTYKGKGHERAASEMLAYKPVYGLSVLKAAKQIGQALRLIIEWKHNLVNKRDAW
jgi:hypothetical protein